MTRRETLSLLAATLCLPACDTDAHQPYMQQAQADIPLEEWLPKSIRLAEAHAQAEAEKRAASSASAPDFGPTGTLKRVGGGPVFHEDESTFDSLSYFFPIAPEDRFWEERSEEGSHHSEGKQPHYAAIYSTDHDTGAGGFGLATASALTDFNEQNVVFADRTGNQTERPFLMWMPYSPWGAQWFAYYDQQGVNNGGKTGRISGRAGQTLLATSPDLRTWTRRGITNYAGYDEDGDPVHFDAEDGYPVYYTGGLKIITYNDRTPWRDEEGYMWGVHPYHTQEPGKTNSNIVHARSLDGVNWEPDPHGQGDLYDTHQPAGMEDADDHTWLGFVPQVWVDGMPCIFGAEYNHRPNPDRSYASLGWVRADPSDPTRFASKKKQVNLDGSEMGQHPTWEPGAANHYTWRLYNSYALHRTLAGGREQVNLFYPVGGRGEEDQQIGLARWES